MSDIEDDWDEGDYDDNGNAGGKTKICVHWTIQFEIIIHLHQVLDCIYFVDSRHNRRISIW